MSKCYCIRVIVLFCKQHSVDGSIIEYEGGNYWIEGECDVKARKKQIATHKECF